MTAGWIGDQPVFQPIQRVARREDSLVNRRIFFFGDSSLRILERLKSHPDPPGIKMRFWIGRRAGNDPVEIVGESCGLNQRSEEHTSELQSLRHLVCRLLLEK